MEINLYLQTNILFRKIINIKTILINNNSLFTMSYK